MRFGALISILCIGAMSICQDATAQVAKEKLAVPKAKVPAEVAKAETALKAANCAIGYEDLPPLFPNGPRRQGDAEQIAFPRDVKDADIAKLIPHALKLPSLKIIDIGDCKNITTKGFSEIAKIGSLKAVYLDGLKMDHEMLNELAKIGTIQYLGLNRCQINDDDLRDIGNFASLMVLKLENVTSANNDYLSSKGIEYLSKIPRLRTLHLTLSRTDLKSASQLAKLTRLTELRVYPVNDQDTVEIAKIESLQVLELHPETNQRYGSRFYKNPRRKMEMPAEVRVNRAVGPFATANFKTLGISSKGIENLARLTDLRVLKVAGHAVNFKDSAISKLEHLGELEASSTELDDAGAITLSKMKSLKKLHISNTYVSSTGVRELSLNGSLEELSADNLAISEDTVKYLSQNRKLKILSLNGTNVDGSDRPAWGAFSRLQNLSVSNTNFSDSTVMTLSAIKTLKNVDLTMNCPNVTWEGVRPLQQEFPGSQIVADSCNTRFWIGGGGVPEQKLAPNIRKPDIEYRAPNEMPKRPMTQVETKAPPPTIRNLGGGGTGTSTGTNPKP